MGTITLQTTETGQADFSKSYTVADADIDRMIQAYQVAANAQMNRLATRTEVLTFISQYFISRLADSVTSYATQDAIAKMAPIAPFKVT